VRTVALVAALATGLAMAAPAARADSVDVNALMAPAPLPDMALGSEVAPITMVEYASLGCPHCAAFHNEVLPALKTKYIDTGKVRLVFREYPLNPISLLAIMLARCAPPERFFGIVDLFFERQNDWAFTQKGVTVLMDLAKQAGFTQESFLACYNNRDLKQAVNEIRARAREEFGVNGTPTFFVNGERVVGELSMDSLDAMFAPILAAAPGEAAAPGPAPEPGAMTTDPGAAPAGDGTSGAATSPDSTSSDSMSSDSMSSDSSASSSSSGDSMSSDSMSSDSPSSAPAPAEGQ
jgi:protein-disulfide isomerase